MQLIPISSHSQVWVLFPRDSHRAIPSGVAMEWAGWAKSRGESYNYRYDASTLPCET